MSLNIGVIYSGSGSKLLCYTEEKGIFVVDSFLSLSNENTIWFTNMKKVDLADQDKSIFKDSAYFGVEISEIMQQYGFSLNESNIKFILKKFYDFVNAFINNVFNQFKVHALENGNKTIKIKREVERIQKIKISNSYSELLLLIAKGVNKSFILETFEHTDFFGSTKTIKVVPNSLFKMSNNDTKSQSVDEWFKINKLRLNRLSLDAATYPLEITIPTLTLDKIDKFPTVDIYDEREYELVSFENELNTPSDYDKLFSEDYLFFKIRIINLQKINDMQNIFKNIARSNFIVSKDLLLRLVKLNLIKVKILEGFVLKETHQKLLHKKAQIERRIQKIFKEVDRTEIVSLNDKINLIEKRLPNRKTFSTKLLKHSFIDEIKLNKLQTHVYIFNYLQTIRFNDNLLLNEWIKSQLLISNIDITEKMISKGFEVKKINLDSITVSIKFEDKENLRKILMELGLFCPSELL